MPFSTFPWSQFLSCHPSNLESHIPMKVAPLPFETSRVQRSSKTCQESNCRPLPPQMRVDQYSCPMGNFSHFVLSGSSHEDLLINPTWENFGWAREAGYVDHGLKLIYCYLHVLRRRQVIIGCMSNYSLQVACHDNRGPPKQKHHFRSRQTQVPNNTCSPTTGEGQRQGNNILVSSTSCSLAHRVQESPPVLADAEKYKGTRLLHYC